jgi:hypothetical protein
LVEGGCFLCWGLHGLGVEMGGGGGVYGVEVSGQVRRLGCAIVFFFFTFGLGIWRSVHYISAVDSLSVVCLASKLLDAGAIPRLRDYIRVTCLGRQEVDSSI